MGVLSTQAKVTYSGRETFHQQLSLTWSPWQRLISRVTWARSSTTSTRLLTQCSLTCLKDHKKRAKYRFASKTLMRILPAPFKGEVEELIEKKTITLDLYEILGKCTWKEIK